MPNYKDPETVIGSCIVKEFNRMNIIVELFGKEALKVEQLIYMQINEIQKQEKINYCQYISLSNGGFFILPNITRKQITLINRNDVFIQDKFSDEALGIIASLQVYLTLYNQEHKYIYLKHFQLLMHFAKKHEEATEIFKTIKAMSQE